MNDFLKPIFLIRDESNFNECALKLFRYQAEHVPVYKEYIRLLKKDIRTIRHYSEIPFLPVSVFKNHSISDQVKTPEFFFSSSGTSGQTTSKHYLADIGIYDEVTIKCFRHFFGDPKHYCFLALLPSYLERPGSSLVYMMQHLIATGNHPLSGFYLYNHEELAEKITLLKNKNEKIFLIGVTYALLDFFEKYHIPLSASHAIVMETGGMKGTRREMVRQEVHELLCKGSGLDTIHSEYGMTELLSQAYSTGKGIFETPPWMKIVTGESHDPFATASINDTGIIKVIDLANIHSCAFIETGDLGRMLPQGFEILGRMDSSELRGCNLMIG